ncbi:hypothetical protein SAMN05660845_1034 [Flavobacterium swingsii]|jgi:hypothetical protein|uniref:YXWGXW repeat-containing protein n=1 Tax=Flavobacterium swingsii TaxID=498292 RepID=A0A1I0WXU3_9FLAO|nr:hypothetical protein [Flavobacterium swingsii]SFA92968.1 hypothetical protein SAMN05660845_1034 [Flavobacterium swingsii]
MKTLKIIILGTFLLVFSFSKAQVSVNVNIGAPPVWGPVVTTEEYYYLPDINSYYDIHQSQFIYLNRGVWIRSASLPSRYRSYNLNTGYVVVLNDYHGQRPYSHYKKHKMKYYKSGNNWEKSRGNKVRHDNGNNHGNNHGNGNGKGNKKGKH